MADAYWDPIFARLIDDLDCVRQMTENLPDRVLIEPVRGNPPLWKQVQVFTKGERFLNRARALEVILRSAATEPALRRVLLWSWVQANDQVLKFVTLPIDRDGEKRLLQGEFGNLAKLAILARIDPREAAKPLYEKVLERLRADQPQMLPAAASPLTASAPDAGTKAAPTAGTASAAGAENEQQRRELEQTRAELRDLRRTLKALEEERRQWEKRFLDRSREGEELTKRLSELEAELKREQSARAKLAKAHTDAANERSALNASQNSTSPTGSTVEPVESPREDSEHRRRRQELEDVVSRRDRALQRQEEELAALRRDLEAAREAGRREDRRIADQGEASRLLQAWQRARLACLYHRWQEGDRGSPHLVWEILGGGFEVTPCTPAECARRTDGEFVLLVETGEPNDLSTRWRWHALETPLEDGIAGVLSGSAENPVLVTTSESYPIRSVLPPVEAGAPLAGRLLNAFGDRPAGVHALRALPTGQVAAGETRLSYAALAAFLRLDKGDPSALRDHLQKIPGTWTLTSDGIDFGRDARLAASGLRLRLPIAIVCGRASCRQAEDALDLVRRAGPGDVCHVCHEEADTSDASGGRGSWNFNRARVLLIGGDEVGTAYQTAATRHQLHVDWRSGFGHIDPQAAGLKDYDLVAVVVRQVSHTLVRELTAAVRRQHARIAFLTRRGVTGVLRELASLLKAVREE